MKLGGGSEERQKKIAIGVFAVLALALLWYEAKDTFFPPTTASVPAATAAPEAGSESASSAEPAAGAGRAAKVVRMSAAELDPTLHMEAMRVSEDVVYAGSGRNIFSPNSAPPPVVIPKPVASARNVAQAAPPSRPAGPPPPPPIDLKFFGFESTENGKRQAFLLHDDNVYLASAGDVVLRRYRVISIDARSIQVEDLQNSNRQTLPLLAN